MGFDRDPNKDIMVGEQCKPTIRFVTLGCAKNEADTDRMRARVLAAGFEVASGVEEFVDVTIINTCAFITDATQETIDEILALVDEKLESQALGLGESSIIVTGCLPARYGDELAEEIPEVDAFVNIKDQDGIVDVICELTGCDAPDCMEAGVPHGILRTYEAPHAYVKISDGCSRFCAFCTIPYIRGAYASRPADEILDEIEHLVSSGVREIILIGQDTGIWGTDFTEPEQHAPAANPNLASLVDCVAKAFPDTWIRVMYLQPEGINDALLASLSQNDNVCNYLDIPLQHSNAKVIREMNRRGDGESYLQTIRHIREGFDDIMVRTTLIAGFPGETDDEFDELLDFVEDAQFDFAGVFGYSKEEGTVAGGRDDQVDEQVIAQRTQEVTDLAERIGHSRIRKRIGNAYDVLVCGRDEGEDGEPRMWGRTMFQAPDVDGVVTFVGDDDLIGSIVRVKIEQSLGYDLEGVLQD